MAPLSQVKHSTTEPLRSLNIMSSFNLHCSIFRKMCSILNQSTQYCVVVFSAAFKMIEGDQAPLQKFVYLIGNFLSLGLAIYKCQGMGLLPTTTSDWLAFVEPQRVSSKSGLQIRECVPENYFSYFSTKTSYVVGTQKNRLDETCLLSTQNICIR